jgi:hypothetical protein
MSAESLADISISPPRDWLDAPPREAVPEHWGAMPVDDWGAPIEAAPRHDPPRDAPPPGARMFGRLRLQSVAEIMAAPPRQYLLQGLFAPAELIVLWGQPKSGKSFLALCLAYGLAIGASLWGRAVPRPVRVLYVAAEGMGGMGARLRALQERLGDTEGRLAVIAQAVQIGPPGFDAEALREAAKAHAADLVVIDTLARTFGDGDENATRDMSAFVAECDRIREETGAAVLVIHHGAKAEGAKTPRGSVALMGAADIILQVAKGAEGAPSLCTIQAAKDDAEGAALPFRLEGVTVGQREDGTPIETCVAVEAEPGRAGKARKLTGAARLAVGYLQDLLARGEGRDLPRGNLWPCASLHGVTLQEWRAECEARNLSTAEKPDDRRRAIAGAMQRAIEAGAVASRDDWAWPVEQ